MNIIFDMDGTLIDTVQITLPAFQFVCPKYGLQIPDVKTLVSAIGYANPFFYYKIYPNIDINLLNEFGEEVEEREIIVSKNIQGTLLFEGIKETLAILLKHGNRLYIASTGSSAHVNSCLEKTQLSAFFEKIHCGVPDKEEMVQAIIKDQRKENWIMVGDKSKDSDAAKYNGISSIGAAYGYCTYKDQRGFDYIASKPSDIVPIVLNRKI